MSGKTSGITAVVGLTGGIASGKSTVAARWRERGVRVIDADVVAREVVAPGEPALAAIARTFGEELLLPDGSLDRARLGAIVFADAGALKRLNALTHPAILARVGAALASAQREGLPWIVYEAALILENGLSPGLTRLVAVITEPARQIERAMARDRLDERAARQRLAAQTDNEARRRAADLVIDNDGSLDDLLAAADRAFDALDAELGPLPA